MVTDPPPSGSGLRAAIIDNATNANPKMKPVIQAAVRIDFEHEVVSSGANPRVSTVVTAYVKPARNSDMSSIPKTRIAIAMAATVTAAVIRYGMRNAKRPVGSVNVVGDPAAKP